MKETPMDDPDSGAEAARRALAVENTLHQLINRLAELGLISVDDAMWMLDHLSKTSDLSAARVSPSMTHLKRLKALRGGDASMAPGADRLG
jgi:hypothetical protein